MDKNDLKLLLSKHNHFTNQLKSLVESLLIANNIKYHIIEHRTKELESLTEKIDRKQLKDVSNVTDLSGIRIIVYYQDDIDKIEKIIESNFKIDKENSIDKSKLYKSNEFGYLSVHYIASLNNEREKLTEWKSSKNLKAEIQVRTVLQHSWASISHELSYKKGYEIPKQLERKLYRLAGLFELADEEFLNIREKHEILFNQLKAKDLSNTIDEESINLLTLKYIFEEDRNTEIFKFIEAEAEKAGFHESEELMNTRNYLSDINHMSKILKINTVEEFYEVLNKNKSLYHAFFSKLIEKNESTVWYGDLEFYTSLSLILAMEKEQLELLESSSKWSNSILKLIIEAVIEVKKL